MGSRQKIAKDAWLWAEHVMRIEDVNSEHIKLAYLLNQECCSEEKRFNKSNPTLD